MKVAKFDKEAYERKWRSLHSSYERYGYNQFNTALKAQIQPIIDHVKAYGGISDTLASSMIRKQPMEVAYRNVYTTVGVKHAAFTQRFVNSIGRKSLPSFFSEKWKQLMSLFYEQHSSQRITDVDDTTRERIKKVLDDSQDLPLSQQATYITDTLSSRDFTRYRAMMIARTEGTASANYGAYIGGMDADYEVGKQWLAILDSATRPDHVTADGQTIAMEDSFIVGGYMAMYPGDVSLPASECIQCRCSVVIVPLLSESGLPILK